MQEVVSEHIAATHLAMHLERLDEAVSRYRQQLGRIPQSPSQLVEKGFLLEVPQDPFGGVYVIDPQTGKVSSSTGRMPSKLHRSKLREKQLKGELGRDF
jgi:hypothetical protein